MPTCPLHDGEKLEPKRKGWFCEECGAIVLGFEKFPRPAGEPIKDDEPEVATEPLRTPMRPRAHSLPYPKADGIPTDSLARVPLLLSGAATTRSALVAPAARSARETLQRLSGFGLPTTLYAQRHGVDDVLEATLARPRRALLVIGEPGAGKTALLMRLVDKLLTTERVRDTMVPSTLRSCNAPAQPIDGRDVVLYVAGHASFSGESSRSPAQRLCGAAVGCADIHPDAFSSLREFVVHLAQSERGEAGEERKVWIVLDGLDETATFPALIAEIDAFLPTVEEHPWLRLVVAARASSYEALPARGAGPVAFENERCWTWFWDDRLGRAVPYMLIPCFEARSEAPAAYAMRQARMPHRACHLGFEELSATVRALVCTPLHLHLFHDAFRGGKVPPVGLDEAGLVDAYLDRLVDDAPGLEQTLPRVGAVLLERRRADLPLAVSEEWRAARSEKRKAGESEVGAGADPLSDLVNGTGLMGAVEAGHGMEPGAGAWQFAHARLAEQVLLRELVSQIAPRTVPHREELLAWAQAAAPDEHGAGFSALAGALETWVGLLAARGERGIVAAVADIEDESTRARLLRALLLALGQLWGTDDEPQPGAARLLDVLVSAASGEERRRRLLASAGAGLGALVRDGHRGAVAGVHRKLVKLAIPPQVPCGAAELLAQAARLEALADVALANGDGEDGRAYLEQAVGRLGARPAGTGAGEALRSMLARCLRKLAKHAVGQGDLRRARARLEDALRIAALTEGGAAVPRTQHEELLLTLLAFGDVAREQGTLREARDALEEAMRASDAALAQTPHRAEAKLCKAKALTGLAEIALQGSKAKVARERLESAVRILRKGCRRDPQRVDMHFELIAVLERLAALLRRGQEDQPACRLQEEAALLLLALVTIHPQRAPWRYRLVQMLVKLGALMRQVGEDEAARACLDDAVRHARVLVGDEAVQGDVRELLAAALMSLVHLDEAERRRFEASRHVREVLDVLRGLVRENVGNEEANRALASALLAQGRLTSDDGEVDEAQAQLGESVRLLDALVGEHPQDVALHAELGAAMTALQMVGGIGRARRIPRHRYTVMVSERGGPRVREYVERDEITIGRAPGNDLMLPNYSVSRHHARVSHRDGDLSILDLGSKHGTRVNGERINGEARFRMGDLVELGDFALVFEGKVEDGATLGWSTTLANAPTGYPAASDDTAPIELAELPGEATWDEETLPAIDSAAVLEEGEE